MSIGTVESNSIYGNEIKESSSCSIYIQELEQYSTSLYEDTSAVRTANLRTDRIFEWGWGH
jgi:hypothetical protein